MQHIRKIKEKRTEFRWQNVKEGGHLEKPEEDGTDNIKVDLIEIEQDGKDWIRLAQYKENVDCIKCGPFLTG